MSAGKSGCHTLVLPKGKLINRSAQAFAYRVLLAAALAKVPIEVVSEEAEGVEGADATILAMVKSYPLPALVVQDTVLFQSKAAIQKILGDCDSLLSAAMEALTLEDKLTVLSGAALTKDFIDENDFKALNMATANRTTQVLVFGLIAACLNSSTGKVAGVAKSWYNDMFQSAIAAAPDAFDRLTEYLPGKEVGQRRVKEGIVFDYDWSIERLPKKETRNILITSALPYVNNVPHLGNIIGAVLSADVFARYCRLRGYQTIYIGGTDEYGTATETKALEEGVSCVDLCAKYYKLHAAVYDWFGVQTDIFGRSSTPQQTTITHEIFKALYGNGYFFEQSVEQSYCETCSRFLADRYVEGTCPHCAYADARGDQCDGCGKLLNPIELKEARCKLCRKQPVIRSSNHLFLDLTKLQSQVESFVDAQSVIGAWSANSTSISKAWLTEGLKPRCMTRDLKWGTPVPVPGFEDKVFYVWFDACFGYLSITANYSPEGWRQWWQASRDGNKVELFQFMGKDNVPFHTVIFPSTLLGTVSADVDCPWTLLHHINTTEYLNYESGKFSKSRGVGVFGNDARDSGIPVAVWRYYLLSVRPETTDSTFSWDDFGARNNNELLANLGNFVSRVSKFAAANFEGRVPATGPLSSVDSKLIDKVNEEVKEYVRLMEGVHLRAALKQVMGISSLGNHYLTEVGLDRRLLQSDPCRCGTIISVALHLTYLLSALLEPFIPTTAEDIRCILNAPAICIPDTLEVDLLLPGHALGTPFHLFTRLEESRLKELRAKFSGKQVK